MTQTPPRPWGKYTAILLIVLLAIRLPALILSPVQLHGDEAQYWAWAQTLDWGYFSKPPMIAWVIASTTAIFGDAEWAVRLSSPLLHTVTATVIFLTGRKLFDARSGFWAAALYALMPAVSLSSGIVSTDVPLLVCWSVALYGLSALRETPNWRYALMTGIAVGLGCLAKYAMFFYLPALIIAVFIDPPIRKAILSRFGATIAVLTALILLPNILWNAANDFATVSHTAANANISGIPFHPLELLEFWTSQLGVFGPVTLVFYVLAAIAGLRGKLAPHGRWLALFVLSPIIIISAEALLSRANANWAVTTYIAGALLTGAYIATLTKSLKWAKLGVLVNIGLGLFVITAGLSPAFVNATGQANAFKRTRGWVQTKTAISDVAIKGHDGQAYDAIAIDNRLVFYDMNYYGLGQTAPLKMWMHTGHASNHAEATAPLPAGPSDRPVLVVNYYDDYEDELRADFARLERIGDIDIDLGGGKRRQLKLWAGYGYTPTKTR